METELTVGEPVTVPTMTQDASGFVVRDGDREIRFTGILLGESSSEQAGKSRWMELKIYRTSGGKYIVTGVGRSTLKGEVDRHWTHVSESPQGALESLYLYDGDEVRYLTRVAKDAVSQAIIKDEALRNAYMVETVE